MGSCTHTALLSCSYRVVISLNNAILSIVIINEFRFDLGGHLIIMVSMMTCSEQPDACDCFPWWEDDRRRMRCVVLMNMAVVGSVNGSGSAKCESWKYEVRGLHWSASRSLKLRECQRVVPFI